MDVRHVFRRGNLLLVRAARHASKEPVCFICECANAECFATVPMTPDEFERLTSAEGCFVVVGGHEEEGEVVLDGGRYVVVLSGRMRFPERREVNAG